MTIPPADAVPIGQPVRPVDPDLRQRRALRPGLWLLAALGIAATLAAGRWANRLQTRSLAEANRQALQVHALGVRGAVGKVEPLPAVVAMQPAVQGLLADPRDPVRQAEVDRYLEAVNRRSGAEALYLMDTRGLTLAASNWREGAAGSFVGKNYGQRPYFADAMAGRTAHFQGVGLTTGRPGLFIAAPVTIADSVQGVVVVKVGFEALGATWAGATDPVLLTDARGIAFLGTVPAWNCHVKQPLSAADLQWVRQADQYPNCSAFPALPWIGRPGLLAGELPLPELGWTITVLTDLRSARQAQWQAWATGALLTALLTLGARSWQQRGQRMAAQQSQKAELERQVLERTRALNDEVSLRRAMENSLLVGMRARDLEGRILYVNPAFCRMVGRDADELVGRLPPYPYWHPDRIDKHWDDNDAVLAGQAAPHGFESVIRHRDGRSVVTMVYTAPLLDAAGRHNGWMSSVVDVTPQRAAEQRLRQQEERLRGVARMVTMGEIASTLAHEINQPLMALSSYADAAARFADQGESAALADCLGRITAESRRAAEVVRRLRRFLNQRERASEVLSLPELAEDMVPVWDWQARARQVRVVVRCADDLPPLRGDRHLIEQVLLNLVTNAIQAASALPAERRVVEVSARRDGATVRVEVADRGPGVPAALVPRLFEAFFTTRDDGLGLGLNTCRTIVEAHGGRIGHADRPGGGALFHFTLPP